MPVCIRKAYSRYKEKQVFEFAEEWGSSPFFITLCALYKVKGMVFIMEKIVVLDGFVINPGDLTWDGLKEFGELTVYDRTPEDKVVERIGNSSVAFACRTPITKAAMDACPSLKFIGALATGYNYIDCEAAKMKGIPVANVPTYGTATVAQHAIALLLEVCNRVGEHSKNVTDDGQWVDGEEYCYWNHPMSELFGKTMGIIGVGRIGETTAGIAKALGMKVIGYDSYINPDLKERGFEFVTLDELYAKADVISLHCLLSPDTRGIINVESISKMKDGVIIINTSRGPLIVEEDLVQALNSGKVYALAADVVSVEPIRKTNPLLGSKKCIITPHIAWVTIEARRRMIETTISNLKHFLSGNPVNVVNP